MPAGDVSRTLCFEQFKREVTAQIRAYWYFATAAKFTDRWWEHVIRTEGAKATITKYDATAGMPYAAVDLSPNVYRGLPAQALPLLVNNTIIAISTALEVYLTGVCRRVVFLRPELTKSSERSFTAGEVSSVITTREPARHRFASMFAEKLTRNRPDRDVVKATLGLIHRSLGKDEDLIISRWVVWGYVRNALVHAGGLVTSDLVAKAPSRFTEVDEPLNLKDRDLMRCQSAALSLASAVDEQVVRSIVDLEDCSLLTRELFVRFGMDDRRELASIVSMSLNAKFGAGAVQKVLDQHKKLGTKPEFEGVTFSGEFLRSVVERG